MPDATNQSEGFDVYSDTFTVTITPFGANLTFALREAHPSSGRAPQSRDLGTLRMSVEHLKTFVMITRRQILSVESDLGVKAEVPHKILNQLGIAPDDWDTFWTPPKSI